MGRSEDLMLQESAIISGDLAARSFPAADREAFTELAGARRTLYNQTLPDLQPRYRAYYIRAISPQAMTALSGLENQLMSDTRTSGPPPVQPQQWEAAVGGVAAGLSRAGTQASNTITAQATTNSDDTYLELILAGGLGLLAVILSIIVSFVIGRGLIRELAALRESALELANVRLPNVVNRLAAGQDVDISAEAPELPTSSDEIGQVQQAFNAVQQTAVEAAVGQARLRQGISDIFRNLARRSQSLLHRQLALLDAMERRAKEPEELEDLFRIDHLTTRMRRHAESLIILSGEAPARAWRRPVPFVDVLRASVAEVEDYTRIKVTTNTRAAITGPAVADVIHMIAELAENAVVFSPPNTPVLISGDVVGRGFAVEIEDRGLGLSEERRAELNDLLENPPPFDLSGSDQLGLFVASQLARKHNIRIVLRGSPYGGTTAIVLIPNALVVSEESYQPDGADPGTGASAGVQLTGRHAARDDTGGLTSGAGDPASPAGKPVLTEVTAAEPDDPAGRWPADSGTDPWIAFAGPAGEDTGNGWAGHGAAATAASTTGASTTAASTAGGNGFSGFPGPGDEGGWPPAGGLAQGDAAQLDDQEDTDFAEADSLPHRVRQASLAPQLRENTLPGRPAPNGDAAAAPGIVAERSPEEARSTITAIQQGWERGRSLFDPPDKTTDAMTGTQPPAEPSPPEPGEAGPQGDE
jgi:signal transduction histidine kinase